MVGDLLGLATTTDKEHYCTEWRTPSSSCAGRSTLDEEVDNCGLAYRQPPTPRDGNCLFHALSDQLRRLGLEEKTASELRSSVVEFLRAHPFIPEGTHFKEFIAHRAWESYLKRMSKDGVWGDWIVLWGLVNMINIDVAVVSSLGENGLRIISPHNSGQDSKHSDISRMALIGHEAENHYHSLEPTSKSTPKEKDPATEALKFAYGEGKISEEVCPNCGRNFECYSKGVFTDESGVVQCYADDSSLCEDCIREHEFYLY